MSHLRGIRTPRRQSQSPDKQPKADIVVQFFGTLLTAFCAEAQSISPAATRPTMLLSASALRRLTPCSPTFPICTQDSAPRRSITIMAACWQ